MLVNLVIFLNSISSASALSPSYPRQEVTDASNDWTIVKTQKALLFEVKRDHNISTSAEYGQNETECKRVQMQDKNRGLFHPPDISSVTYLSDGKTLNVTLWLSSPFRQPPNNASEWLRSFQTTLGHSPWYTIVYRASVAVKSVYDTQGADYSVRYKWDALNTTWARAVYEHSPSLYEKVLDQKDNYSLFPTTEKQPTYINMSLDLVTLNFPDQYELVFSAYDYFIENYRVCPMSDIVSRVFVPPPRFEITSLPSSVEMRPGESKTVEVQLKSDANIKSQVLFSTDTAGLNDNIESNLTSSKISVPINGVVTSRLDISASETAEPGSYTIPILSKINITTEAKPRRSVFTGEIATNPVPQNFSESTGLTVTVLPSMTLPQYIDSVIKTWSSPIKELIGIFTAVGTAGGITYGAIRWLRKRNHQHLKEAEESEPI